MVQAMASSQSQATPPRGVGEALGAFLHAVATLEKIMTAEPDSEPSPMNFGIATPMQEPGGSANVPPGTLQELLAAAEVVIATLQAELSAAKEKNELAVKIALLEAKHEAAAEIVALHVERQQLIKYIARMEEAWEQ